MIRCLRKRVVNVERKILQDLLKWKTKKNRKPLLVSGVSQSGKTYAIKEYWRQYGC